jgi:hypothetical protein
MALQAPCSAKAAAAAEPAAAGTGRTAAQHSACCAAAASAAPLQQRCPWASAGTWKGCCSQGASGLPPVAWLLAIVFEHRASS